MSEKQRDLWEEFVEDYPRWDGEKTVHAALAEFTKWLKKHNYLLGDETTRQEEIDDEC